jgi:hypothetical protein
MGISTAQEAIVSALLHAMRAPALQLSVFR